MPWKVPAQGSAGGASAFRPSTRASTWPARRSISCAARREKVSSSSRCGSTPPADEVGHAVRQRAGLARAGARNDQQRALVTAQCIADGACTPCSTAAR
jgi:hypothetical protein